MLNKICKTSFVTTVAVLPMITYGALDKTSAFFTSAKDIVTNILIPLAFTLALLFFFWGVAKYIWSAGDAKEEGKKIMVWGVIALFVMSSIWGIITVLKSDLGIGDESSMPVPKFE
ncbi:MAG: hypothetical protein A3D37_02125 [Candidatus Zambryskibacteria bacterium RIFCSPHIGHO2_02_FULL_38_22]|nr:MAG: hypothetical protein A3D37_02125 [Candidatus Zambryskibacteria bacterium RIFCSPHIGHO2_02_FULL_38_22]OHB08764.1 MAG: hypothetical protein A3I19_02195 [Candidatus Zambryskibacteria bacterium RIFCSPLOWO2_02_FULL_38_13]